jgi:glycosyltransferase involved in cell wall biosynthesis
MQARRRPCVLQIVPALDGGVARAAGATAAARGATGGRALIASPGGPMLGELRRLKMTHIDLPAARDSLLQAWTNARRLRETIAAHGVDIVHAHDRVAAWTARRLAGMANTKVVASVHRPCRGERWTTRRLEAAQAQADAVAAVSDFVAESVRARYPAAADRTATIRTGINMDRFDPGALRAERLIKLAAHWRLPDDRKVILFPARLDRDRGQLQLVHAIRQTGRRDI